jgi:hypothetical protein
MAAPMPQREALTSFGNLKMMTTTYRRRSLRYHYYAAGMFVLLCLNACTETDVPEQPSGSHSVRLQVAPPTDGSNHTTSGTRAAVEQWNNTTVALAYHTGDASPYAKKVDLLIPAGSGTGSISLETGLDYPSGTTPFYLRGYYPATTAPDAIGHVTYDLSAGDIDLMASQEMKGTRDAAKMVDTDGGEVMKFRHLLTRVTFDLMAIEGQTVSKKVAGIRIVPKTSSESLGMKYAVLDLAQPISATNPNFLTAGNIEHRSAAGYDIPAYDTSRGKQRIDLMFRPDVPFDVYVIYVKDGNDVAVKADFSASTELTTLCSGGGTAGTRYLINLNFYSEYVIKGETTDWDKVTGDASMGHKDEIIDYTQPEYEDANCYMLHPKEKGNRIYLIPVSRINAYWNGTAAGYGKSSAPLTSGKSWYASVLWSDMTEITTSTPIKVSGTFTGTRTNDYFKVTIPAGTEPGNFVVAVKDASGTILWSWHLWVTNYDPDTWLATKPSVAAKTSYDVTGGQVQSYGGTMWESESGALYRKVMMDRNLGSIADSYSAAVSTAASETSLGQLYYQFGRKDPFPTSLDGTSTLKLTGLGTFPTPAAGGAVSIATSVNNPTTFYIYSGNWTSDANGTDYLWNDPNVSVSSGAKSIYDPCPVGWRLPLFGTWSDFSTATFPWQPSPAGRVYNNSTVFYAVAGGRNSSSGGLNLVGTEGYYWSATPDSDTIGQNLRFSSSIVYPQSYSSYRAAGFPVRCSQE